MSTSTPSSSASPSNCCEHASKLRRSAAISTQERTQVMSEHNLEVVEQFFSGPRDLDRLSLMSDDCEWFNGIGKFPAAPGQTTFVGKDEIGRVVLGRAPSPTPRSGR